MPTGPVYFDPATGIRTALIYNPTATSQTVNLYNQGVAVATYTVPANMLSVVTPGYTNRPVLTIQSGATVNWPTIVAIYTNRNRRRTIPFGRMQQP